MVGGQNADGPLDPDPDMDASLHVREAKDLLIRDSLVIVARDIDTCRYGIWGLTHGLSRIGEKPLCTVPYIHMLVSNEPLINEIIRMTKSVRTTTLAVCHLSEVSLLESSYHLNLARPLGIHHIRV